MSEGRGRYSRGYLPHVDEGNRTQFVTFRLTDSLPKDVLVDWKNEVSQLDEVERKSELYRRIETYLDEGHGSAVLGDPRVARIVQESLFFAAKERCVLHGWSILSNHVHTLFTPTPGYPLAKIMQGIKSYSSHEIKKVLGTQGRLWQPEYFDRMIRSEDHFQRVLKYIEWNPVKAGLCADPSIFPYSSAYPANLDRLLQESAP